ncbi:hypothetical protein ES705_42289 [subsurface metagenome]
MGGSVNEITGEKRFTSLALVWTFILFIIAGLATLIFSFVNIFLNPKAIKNFLIALGIAVVLIGISYLISSSKPIDLDTFTSDPSAGTLKWVGTGLIVTYILAIVAFFGIIASEILRAFK